jgi:hypothetical protein
VQRKRPLAPGDLAAANIGEGAEEWIVATLVGPAEGGRLEVRDDEAEPGTVNRHVLDAHCVIPLPRTASSREERALPQGSAVLSVFPGTTTFYHATVLQAPRRLAGGEWGEYTLQFDDDDELEAGQGRLVDFRHVVRP